MRREYFSGDCNKACDANAPNDIRAACDEGSYRYCTDKDSNNLFKPECTDFINRVETTITDPNKKGLLKVIPFQTKTLQDYQKGLAGVFSAFCAKETNTTGDTCLKTYPSMFKNTDYTARMDMLFSSLVKIGANPKTTDKKFYLGGIDDKKAPIGIDAVAGFLKWKEDQIKAAYNEYTREATVSGKKVIVPKDDKKREAIFDFFVDPNYVDLRTLYPKEFEDIEKAVIIERRMLDNRGLIIAMNNSDVVVDKVYTLISNELSSDKGAEDLDVTLGLVSIFLKNAEDANIGLSQKNREKSDFTELKKIVTTLSILQKGGLCQKSPMDPKCVELSKIDKLVYKGNDMANDVKKYLRSVRGDTICDTQKIKQNAATIFGPECKDMKYGDADRINIMQYCLTDGKNDENCKKKPFPTYIDAKWLKSAIDTEFDKDGKIVKVRCDGKDGRFTADECRTLCDIYPDICKEDIITKCSNEDYRFSRDKNVVDAFQSGGKETYMNGYPSDDTCMSGSSCMYYVLLFIIFILFVSILRSTCMRPSMSMVRVVPLSPYAPINNQKI